MRLLHFSICIFGCVATLAAAPAITGVYNAGSWIPASLPNSGVAQGAYFTVTGSGLGPSTLVVAASYPLPTTQGLGGTTVQVKVGTVTQTCIMYYTSSTQVSAIVPSATPIGTGTLTVSYQGALASATIQVVAASFGMFTLNSGGTGPASITDLNYSPITMINVAHPGDNIVLWGTGLGAVTGDETEPPATAKNFSGVQVLIQNQLVTPSYAGRSSYPGLDQINVTVPAGISGGCKTSIAVVVNGVTGNVVSTSVGPAGQTTCSDTYGALTGTNMQKAVSNGALNIAAVDLSRIGTNSDILAGSFATYPVNSLIRSFAGSYGPSIGGCVVYEQAAGTTLLVEDPVVPGLPHLDAGAALVVTPQGGTAVTVSAMSTGAYGAALGSSANPYIVPGTYSVANGNGGSQVGAFNWTATLPGALSFVNPPSTINRTQSLTVNWTASSAFTLVSILGYSAVPLSTTENSFVEFVCTAPATATQFTIPPSILSMLPTNGYGAVGVTGAGLQIAGVIDDQFTVSGSPGIDAGQLTLFTATGPIVKVQ
jgi:uncharacterized protein (TIGR03437 family)